MKKNILNFIKELYKIWVTERPNVLAAALAYFGMFSFAPVIYIAFTVAGLFSDNLFMVNNFLEKVEDTFGADIAELIQSSVNNLSQIPSEETSLLSSIIAFFALLLAASGLFFQIQYALNTLWEVPLPDKNETTAMLKQRLFSFLMVIGVGLVLIVATLMNIILSWLDSLIPLLAEIPYLNSLSFFGLAMLSFALIYKILPDTDVAWRDVWAASAVTVLLMSIGGKLLGFYLTSGNFNSAFEAAGAVAVILISFYIYSQIFLFGAVFTRAYAYCFGSKVGKEI
ncbi:MAG TPA: YihY/virulence factor BrkB family protein [Anaerolineales bacterium]|nr:YihY/virulence factor BrkB family protein [Anaerolineales bacterium]